MVEWVGMRRLIMLATLKTVWFFPSLALIIKLSSDLCLYFIFFMPSAKGLMQKYFASPAHRVSEHEVDCLRYHEKNHPETSASAG